jgi:RNA polymerase primary sigma factor
MADPAGNYSCNYRSGGTIRVPVHLIEALRNLKKTEDELRKSLGPEPSVIEIAEELNAPVSKIMRILKTARELVSLETGVVSAKSSI